MDGFVSQIECGCTIRTRNSMWVVDHCPLHAAAEQMLEALKDIATWESYTRDELRGLARNAIDAATASKPEKS